jgi:hypothetical protein
MKHFFNYNVVCKCGLPEVTLEGEKEDWEDILQRIEKLKEYGVQAIAWYHLLRPVLTGFVNAFDAPNGKANMKFWSHVVTVQGNGSGPRYTGGWITAFCAWDAKGEWLGFDFQRRALEKADPKMAQHSASKFESKYLKVSAPSSGFLFGKVSLYEMDDVTYHPVMGPPAGYAEVDIHVNDCGKQYECRMVAGSVGMMVEGEDHDHLKPVSGWWIYTKSEMFGKKGWWSV